MKSRSMLAVALAAILYTLPVAASADEADPKGHHPREAKAAAQDKETKDGPAEGSQQHKMKVCNVEAGKKNLKGDERRSFMSSCLKG